MTIARLLTLVGMVACAAVSMFAQTYNISTVAGATTSGSVNATGRFARFYEPSGVVLDNAGSLFVADTYNRTIRKVTQTGVVTTVAGLAGAQGIADGTGNGARFYFVQGIAMAPDGNIFVSDYHAIRKVTPAGVVTTFAGIANTSGNADGTGNEARFYSPWGIIFDPSGNLFVADGNRSIRKITTNAVVTTIAGGYPGFKDGTGTNAGFIDPKGIALDPQGNIYVAEWAAHVIRKITPDGVVTTFAGKLYDRGFQDGVGGAARFGSVFGVAADSAGNVYVTDGNTIRKITPAAVVTTIAGIADGQIGYADGPGSSARFYGLVGLTVDKSGNLLIADTNNNMIRKGTPILPLQIYSAGSRLAVAWPSWAANYLLENRQAIGDTNAWTVITNGIASDTNNFTYAFPPTNSAQFFRVRSP